LALHDPLTGLPNRALFHARLNDEISHAHRRDAPFAVLVCDLDRFKTINDTMGHAAGDLLLRICADRLQASVREGDMVARLGGDEFAIILHRAERPDVANVIAERIVAAIEEPFEIEGRNIAVGISVGFAISDAAGTNADGLVRNADLALYRAKAEGRNTYRCFELGMDVVAAESIMLEHELREAVRRRDFVLHYQPVLDLTDNAVCGFEALMRWQHPTRGALSPDLFIPLAEESGLIVILGEWALREACRQAKLWPKHLRMAVNVSAIQFRHPGRLQRSVVAALAASGLEPARLELEVTESVLIQDADSVIACLSNLRELGVRIALDDFGTGYSSLAYLRRFPFDKIKIDRSFVREIDDPQTAAIVAAVVGLGARVGADVTAEGVETSDQRRQVHAAGCTQLQGFLFGRPLPADEAGAIAIGGSHSIAA
jgi:diguanylate cyclase (GGDEF)-like protein